MLVAESSSSSPRTQKFDSKLASATETYFGAVEHAVNIMRMESRYKYNINLMTTQDAVSLLTSTEPLA